MPRCDVCKRQRQRKSLSRILFPLTIVTDFSTFPPAESTFAEGTIICPNEWRVLFNYAKSEGHRIVFNHGRVYRDDGKSFLEAAFPLDQ